MSTPPILLPDCVGPGQAARELGVSAEWLRQLLRSGRIAYLETPIGRLPLRASLDRFIAEREAARCARAAG